MSSLTEPTYKIGISFSSSIRISFVALSQTGLVHTELIEHSLFSLQTCLDVTNLAGKQE